MENRKQSMKNGKYEMVKSGTWKMELNRKKSPYSANFYILQEKLPNKKQKQIKQIKKIEIILNNIKII